MKKVLVFALTVSFLLNFAACSKKDVAKSTISEISNAAIGETVVFGSCEQDGKDSNGYENIEWIVLDRDEEDNVLVISKYALEVMAFSDSGSNYWENSPIRTWLNETFYYSAFDDTEKAMVLTTDVIAERCDCCEIYSGASTEDKLFLLSKSESEIYFSSNDERLCYPTEYVKNKGYRSDVCEGGPCFWWLRTSCSSDTHVRMIGDTGGFYNQKIEFTDHCVRPAMWISVK